MRVPNTSAVRPVRGTEDFGRPIYNVKSCEAAGHPIDRAHGGEWWGDHRIFSRECPCQVNTTEIFVVKELIRAGARE